MVLDLGLRIRHGWLDVAPVYVARALLAAHDPLVVGVYIEERGCSARINY
jgi:hypothetical protein